VVGGGSTGGAGQRGAPLRCACVCGCVCVWLCGCAAVWLCGCAAVWLCVWLCAYVCSCVGVWVQAHCTSGDRIVLPLQHPRSAGGAPRTPAHTLVCPPPHPPPLTPCHRCDAPALGRQPPTLPLASRAA
jgi:hypothetical protein